MQRTFFRMVLFIISAIPFCCGVSLTVKCISVPSSRHSYRKGLLVYSPPLSEWSTLIFLSVFFFMFFFHSTKNFRTFPFVLHGIYPTSSRVTSPRVIIYKRYKVMVTSNRCYLGRSPDICVKIIQNPLGAISCSAKSHLALLSDDVMFTKF